ncbi:hypothetical protein BOX15_Mlig030527g1 [Macrostomum lignano]|uniref:Essential MCU regulator, mitochondrial n=1 Tax=Macrostomum lignano TaxID=282301 RepID=A0A267FB07_9PLAT|nr:hypothetical protein BOX15_Mlig027202g1 [Macrostomum lignano]PAA80307.1 hypothetical protein BOX15_Mlig030527g1 [Macrostomum lignano]
MRPTLLVSVVRRGFSVLAASSARRAPRASAASPPPPPPVRCYDGSGGAYRDTGALHDKPLQTPLGLVKAMLLLVPSLLLGAGMSREGAAFLEENDIFVPDDDDD